MKVLGIDSSTLVGGASVMIDGRLAGEYVLNVEMTHSERLMPAIERVLADCGMRGSELNGIAVSQGPGSFTGLRIGITTAKTLAYCWNVPLVGVGTLDALAFQAANWCGELICPVLNARRNEVYAGLYSREPGRGLGRATEHDPEHGLEDEVVIQSPVALPMRIRGPLALPLGELLGMVKAEAEARNARAVFLGDGVALYWKTISAELGNRAVRAPGADTVLRPSSIASVGEALLNSGESVDPMQLVPTYVRKSEAEIKWEKKHGLSYNSKSNP